MSGQVRWLLVGLLFLATLLNYLDRQTLSVSASRVLADMGLNDRHFGRWLFAFFLAYGLAQIVIGPLLDRCRVIGIYALAVAAWSLAGAAAALSTGFWSLLGLRVLLGICESPNWPLALRVVARVFPPAERALATGLFQCGTSVGALVAPPIIIALTTAYSWRVSFVVVGLAGLLWSVLWLAFFRLWPQPALTHEHIAAAPAAGDVAAAEDPSSVRAVLRSRRWWLLLVATCFLNPLQYFYTSWLPRYFEAYAGADYGRGLAQRLVLAYLALDAGLIVSGVGVAVLARRLGVTRARQLAATVGALAMTTVPLASRTTSLDAITAVICVATFGLGAFMANYLAFSSEVSTTRISTVTGMLGGAGALSGALFMWVVGDSVAGTGGFTAAFWMAGVMPLVALTGLLLATWPAAARPAQTAAALSAGDPS